LIFIFLVGVETKVSQLKVPRPEISLTNWFQGYTLEEMDELFNSGVPAWRTHVKKSRLDELEQEIAAGHLKVDRPVNNTVDEDVRPDKKHTEPVGSHEENGQRV
jgi:hypothetical protein